MTEGLPIEPLEKRTFWQVLTSEKYFKWTLIIPLLLILAVFMFYPLFYCMYQCSQESVVGGASQFVGLENFRALMYNSAFWKAFSLTGYCLVVCIGVELILGMAIALLLNREFKGQNIIRGLCLLPLLLSPLAMSLMWGYMLNPQYGIVNAMLSAIGLPKVEFFSAPGVAILSIMFTESWKWLPFSIFVLLAGMRGLPRDAFEAAKVDGASPWYTFRRLTLPMLMPLILIIVLLRTCWLIRLYDPIFGTTQGGMGTEVLDWYITRIAFVRFDIGQGATMALLALYITIIICALLYRRLMKALGAAK